MSQPKYQQATKPRTKKRAPKYKELGMPLGNAINEEKKDQIETRIGIDFGGVIRRDDGEPHDQSFETVRFVIAKYGAQNCFIVSKANQEARNRILQWLQEYAFYDTTGFVQRNLYFVKDYQGKKEIVDKLSIHIFIDDKMDNIKRVITAQCIQKVIWFNHADNHKYTEPANVCRKIKEIERKQRHLLVVSKNWNRVQKNLSKTPSFII